MSFKSTLSLLTFSFLQLFWFLPGPLAPSQPPGSKLCLTWHAAGIHSLLCILIHLDRITLFSCWDIKISSWPHFVSPALTWPTKQISVLSGLIIHQKPVNSYHCLLNYKKRLKPTFQVCDLHSNNDLWAFSFMLTSLYAPAQYYLLFLKHTLCFLASVGFFCSCFLWIYQNLPQSQMSMSKVTHLSSPAWFFHKQMWLLTPPTLSLLVFWLCFSFALSQPNLLQLLHWSFLSHSPEDV